MKNNATLIYNLGLVVGDCLALFAAFVSAYAIRASSNVPVPHPIPAHTYVGIFWAVLPFWVLIFALLGLYISNIYERRFSEAARLLVGSFIGMLFLVFWNYMSLQPIFPAKLVPIYGFALAFVYLLIFRNLARYLRTLLFGYQVGLTNILLVGNTEISDELIEQLIDTRRSGYRLLGVVGGKRSTAKHPHLAIFSTFEEAMKKIGPDNLHIIVQTELYADDNRNEEILSYAQEHHIGYRFIPGNSELFVGNIDVELFRGGVPVIAVRPTALFGWGRIVKRLFDFGSGLLLLIITSPLMLLIIIGELFSGGRVFFRQKRLTRYNNEFKVYKFRTLKKAYNGLTPEEAFTKLGHPELIKLYRDNGDWVAHDPRFSRFGRFLRRTSLDELPQLFNVVRGDISLVGPRALVPQELSAYEKRHTILSVKSGLTGLAQVSGRKNISFEERRKLDLYYVQNWSFWQDLIILAKTVRVILQGS